PDGPGVVVAPVADASATLAMPLAEAMAAALRDAEIPASTAGTGNKESYHLIAAEREKPHDDGQSSVVIAWELRRADGEPLGHGTTEAEVASAPWQAADKQTLHEVAAKAAPTIAGLMQDDPPKAVPVSEVRLAVRPVTGAPGDGGHALTRAMDFALRHVHIAIAEKQEDESLVLTGKVEMSPPEAGQQQVKVSWALSRPDGHEIGEISQENAVPAHSLDGNWGEIALAVANAAAPGVAQLVARAK
ncbi:MAG TPA: hypothetical protein VLX85_03140, partial [Stellaceae bacterium]|nr:hypothetical protein [Stellaceae bacterium]